MTFWTYMLQCGGRHFYVGHTNDLEQRMGEHHAGTFGGYTSTRHPLHLVWSHEFPTRHDALEAERRLKGWRREKKLALIRGDWDAISTLARTSKEGRASTSSARTEWRRASNPMFLHPHLSQLPSQPFSLEADLSYAADRLRVRFSLTGDVNLVRLPALAAPERRDGLWQHTCFEVFARPDKGDAYMEFNLAPSQQWAAYRFKSYREAMVELDMAAPSIRSTTTNHTLHLTATLTLPPDLTPTRIGLSAVIEETSGRKSYWALAHPPGDKPDFHHPDCFAFELPPAGEP